eukprot:NODE_173_length_14219_cov_0.603824.p11 type:complete len:132 gc:universal NODE_173_length_14219_cov_0.603824:14140-13745(-)
MIWMSTVLSLPVELSPSTTSNFKLDPTKGLDLTNNAALKQWVEHLRTKKFRDSPVTIPMEPIDPGVVPPNPITPISKKPVFHNGVITETVEGLIGGYGSDDGSNASDDTPPFVRGGRILTETVDNLGGGLK